MIVNGREYKPISFSNVDCYRLLLLVNMKTIFNQNYYSNNKEFLSKIGKPSKFKMNNELRFLELCDLYPNIRNKFGYLYGYNVKKMMKDLYNYYIPLSHELSRKVYDKSPYILGIQANQGCGKTTFCDIMKYIINKQYINTKSLSIDDIYLPFDKLQELKVNNPLYKYRGPPGTHDIDLGMKIVGNVKNSIFNYELPIFDKKLRNGFGDRCKEGIAVYRPVDLLLFEGWFLGAEPIDYNVNELQTIVNEKLKEYKELWNSCDEWIILRPLDITYSRFWRIEAERFYKGLDEQTITDFVDYSWKSLPPHIYFSYIAKGKKILQITVLDQNRNIYL